jgi:redox-sensitive bicupin YhaK (pirin superfamily)
MSTSLVLAQPIQTDRSPASARRIVQRTRGRDHGGITRLVSPSDLGQLIKPFVFLDHAIAPYTGKTTTGIHPHSGIATLTLMIDGGLHYEDTTGKSGEVEAGGLEWMKAGGGVWHDGAALAPGRLRAYQLWVALPAAQENSPAESQYITATDVQQHGPARVILGQLGSARSPITSAPAGINYFHVLLKAGERWRYEPPRGHTVGWVAVYQGELRTPELVSAGTLAVFDASEAPIEFVAAGDTSFVLGSAIPHPHDLVLGYYSVHTNADALRRGEAEIQRIGERLRAEGRI